MNRYEKGPAATNYYHNNGYDERWDMEADTGGKNSSILKLMYAPFHSIIVKHQISLTQATTTLGTRGRGRTTP